MESPKTYLTTHECQAQITDGTDVTVSVHVEYAPDYEEVDVSWTDVVIAEDTDYADITNGLSKADMQLIDEAVNAFVDGLMRDDLIGD